MDAPVRITGLCSLCQLLVHSGGCKPGDLSHSLMWSRSRLVRLCGGGLALRVGRELSGLFADAVCLKRRRCMMDQFRPRRAWRGTTLSMSLEPERLLCLFTTCSSSRASIASSSAKRPKSSRFCGSLARLLIRAKSAASARSLSNLSLRSFMLSAHLSAHVLNPPRLAVAGCRSTAEHLIGSSLIVRWADMRERAPAPVSK